MQEVFLLLLLFAAHAALAGEVTGTVTDEHGTPMPYVSVYIKGTTTGTSTNENGEYFLRLDPGNYELVWQCIGYNQHTERVQVGQSVARLSVRLQPISYTLSAAVVTGGGEDPAYAIIRNAIALRKHYLRQVEGYDCRVYIKEINKIRNVPERIMGIDIPLVGLDSSRSGILYFSETVSTFSFQQPDYMKERIISSKVSGNKQGFSWNRASDLIINFYENIMEFGPITPRGIVSPIASNALFYYKYRLDGYYEEDGVRVNRIAVIPKRRDDPVLADGMIYIQEDTWRIHAVDVMLQKNAQVDYLDSLRISQSFVRVNDSVWLHVSQQFDYTLKLFGFNVSGSALGVYSDYAVNPPRDRKFFNNERVFIEGGANKRDTVYWEEARPVRLTEEEEGDYRRKDSLEAVRHSKAFLDSIDAKTNRPTFWKLLLWGYEYEQRYKKRSLSVTPLVRSIAFNTVEGWNAGMEIGYRKEIEERRYYRIAPAFRYGFSNRRLNASLFASYRASRMRNTLWSVRAGKDVVQFSDEAPLSPFLNSVYTLLLERNHMKIYEKAFARLSWRSEVSNGILLSLFTEYAERIPLANTTDYSWNDFTDRDYTANDTDPLSFVRHRAFIAGADVRIRFAQQYETHPDRKINYGSKYPALRLSYRKALPGVGAGVSYDYLSAGTDDRVKMGMLGRLEYEVKAGVFLRSDSMAFMDYAHFNGNRTVFITKRLSQFQLPDYYAMSTDDRFAEAHLLHHFNGFLINKIPLLRKTKFQVVAGAGGLYSGGDKYWEAVTGIENILKTGRLYFVAGGPWKGGTVYGVKIGVDMLMR